MPGYCPSLWTIPEDLKSLCFRSFTRLLSPRIQAPQRAQFAWGCKNFLLLWGLRYMDLYFCFFFNKTSLILNYLFPYYFFWDMFYKLWRQKKERGRQRGKKKEMEIEREDCWFFHILWMWNNRWWLCSRSQMTKLYYMQRPIWNSQVCSISR